MNPGRSVRRKAEYRRIAAFYDTGQSLSEQTTALWLDLVSRLSRRARRRGTRSRLRYAPSRIEAVRNRNTPVLTMIPEESFQEGLRNLEDCVRRHPDDDRLLFDRMTMTIGRNSPGGDR